MEKEFIYAGTLMYLSISKKKGSSSFVSLTVHGYNTKLKFCHAKTSEEVVQTDKLSTCHKGVLDIG